MFPRVTHPCAGCVLLRPLDLHVLSLPPAFVLSQDQTLMSILYISSPYPVHSSKKTLNVLFYITAFSSLFKVINRSFKTFYCLFFFLNLYTNYIYNISATYIIRLLHRHLLPSIITSNNCPCIYSIYFILTRLTTIVPFAERICILY